MGIADAETMGRRGRALIPAIKEQAQQSEWKEQWTLFTDNERSLFQDWIYPNRLEDFAGKTVLDCGCGGGQHVEFCAPFARLVVGVDLNTAAIARQRNRAYPNTRFIQADIACLALRQQFDIVYCIGVIHHTIDPQVTFENLKRLCRPGGRIIIWCYSAEGNALVRCLVEPLKSLFLKTLRRRQLRVIAWLLSAMLWVLAHSLYLLPLTGLPYYDYLRGLRRLSFPRVVLNVFDKLNAPITHFIPRQQIQAWLNSTDFTDVHISPNRGVSWRASGTMRKAKGEG